MRYALMLALILISFLSKAGTEADTATYWIINYDKAVMIKGSLNAPVTPRREITVTNGSLKDLTISFVYDAVQPKISSLVVKEKNEVLRTIAGDPDMGPVFTVPVRELIGTHQANVQYELDFYYTDDRGQKNLKLGTLIFSFK